jgi:hypothetical protein
VDGISLVAVTAPCRTTTWTAEILVNPRVIDGQQFFNCANGYNFPISQNGHAITNGIERIQIMRNQKNGEAKRLF